MHAYCYFHCDSVISHPCGGQLGAGYYQENISTCVSCQITLIVSCQITLDLVIGTVHGNMDSVDGDL